MADELQVLVEKRSPALWQVTLNNPPINLVDPDTIRQLEHLVDQLEINADVRVVVFRSTDPEFFLAHIDVAGDYTSTAPGKTGMHPWL